MLDAQAQLSLLVVAGFRAGLVDAIGRRRALHAACAARLVRTVALAALVSVGAKLAYDLPAP